MRINLYNEGYDIDWGQIDSFELPAPEDVGRTAKDATRVPFIWKTQKGELEYLENMETTHLFYTLRMLHNNTVPPMFRILAPLGKFNRYADIKTWDKAYIRKAFKLMHDELISNRWDELTEEQQNVVKDIDDTREFLEALLIAALN